MEMGGKIGSEKVGIRKREEEVEEEEGKRRRACGWPSSTSSRIVRVSRASGGKDRHSKVWTSKGLRDRRVRLSVNTAIQFYDLQDRLGYDQPSKAVEWLLKAAAASIDELPSIDTSFSDASLNAPAPFPPPPEHQHQHHSSTSEGSGGLSLSRSESRMKARERARERAADKDKEDSSSFTHLLTRTGNGRQWPLDYFGGLSVSSTPPSSSPNLLSPLFNHHYSFLPDHHHHIPATTTTSTCNFTISPPSAYAGFNRGTLQSNSPSLPMFPFTPTAPPPHFLPCYAADSDHKGKLNN